MKKSYVFSLIPFCDNTFTHMLLVDSLKDPVLPMILAGLTMNFILYEEDYGLAIARLCTAVSTFR